MDGNDTEHLFPIQSYPKKANIFFIISVFDLREAVVSQAFI